MQTETLKKNRRVSLRVESGMIIVIDSIKDVYLSI